MAPARFLQIPEVAALRCAVVALAASLLMLFADWVVIPTVLRLPGSVSPRFTSTPSSLQLFADLVATFAVAVFLMRVARPLAGLYGIVAPAVMAVIGWGRYFVEVGFFSGMRHSEYAWWYEGCSFMKYWLALYVSFKLLPRLTVVGADREE